MAQQIVIEVPGTKISELEKTSSVSRGDVAPVVQGEVTKQADIGQISDFVKSELGSAALKNETDFATPAAVVEVSQASQLRDDAQNERIDNVEHGLVSIGSGADASFSTYAEMIAYVPPKANVSVRNNDPDPALRGVYTWTGTEYVDGYDPLAASIEYTDEKVGELSETVKNVISDDPTENIAMALPLTDKDGWFWGYLGLDGSFVSSLFAITPENSGLIAIDEDGWIVLENYIPPEEKLPIWANLKAMFFGDSITQTGDPDNGNFGKGFRPNWPDYAIPQLLIKEFMNFARSGASYREYGQTDWQKIKHQITYALSVNFQPDIIYMSCGTNDGNVKLGTYEDAMLKDIASLDMTITADALRWALYTIQNNYPNAKKFSCLPIQRHDQETSDRQNLIDLIRKMSGRYGFIVIDCHNKSGIVKDFEIAGQGRDLYDGIHPDESGRIKMGNLIVAETRAAFNY